MCDVAGPGQAFVTGQADRFSPDNAQSGRTGPFTATLTRAAGSHELDAVLQGPVHAA